MSKLDKSKDELRSALFERSRVDSEIKLKRQSCIRELTDKFADEIVSLQESGDLSKFSLTVYLNDFVGQVRDIISD